MTRPCAILDACVFYPAPLRDLLVELAESGAFRAKWTATIHDEWMRNVLKDRSDLASETLERTRDLMDRSVPDCLVSDYEWLIPAIDLPDPDDRHVVPAAIHGRADVIVTFNLKDFPHSSLGRYNLESQHPDDFILRLFHRDASMVIGAASKIRARLRRPPKSAEEYLFTLEKQRLPKVAACLRPWAGST